MYDSTSKKRSPVPLRFFLCITGLTAAIHFGQKFDRSHTLQLRELRDQVREMQDFVADVIRERPVEEIERVFAGGRTPLMMIAEGGHSTLMKKTLALGPNIEARDSRGQTPLILAVRTSYCRPKVVQLLVDHGADVNAKDDAGMTALCHAEKRDCLYKEEVIDILVAAGGEGCDPE